MELATQPYAKALDHGDRTTPSYLAGKPHLSAQMLGANALDNMRQSAHDRRPPNWNRIGYGRLGSEISQTAIRPYGDITCRYSCTGCIVLDS